MLTVQHVSMNLIVTCLLASAVHVPLLWSGRDKAMQLLVVCSSVCLSVEETLILPCSQACLSTVIYLSAASNRTEASSNFFYTNHLWNTDGMLINTEKSAEKVYILS